MNEYIKRGKNYRRVFMAVVILAVVVAVLSNLCAYFATEAFGLKLDLTENKLYELSDTTIDTINKLPTEVNIQIFNKKQDFLILIREILDKYRLNSTKISIEFLDPYENPKLVQKYKEQGYEITLNSVVVQGTDRKKVFQITEFYDIDNSTNQVRSCIAEQVLTSAIVYVTSQSKPMVLFSDGHDEQPSAALMEIFELNNYEVKRTALAITGIDPNAELLVIASPSRDFAREEIELIEAYLGKGGRLMVFLPPSNDDFPLLFKMLSDWGIGVSNNVVFEEELFSFANPINVAATYLSHEITTYFAKNRYYVIMPSSRALSQLYVRKGNIFVSPVLVSSSKSYAKNSIEVKNTAQATGDEQGPFVLAVGSVKQPVIPGEKSSKIFVVGSKNIYADDLMTTKSLANHDFLIQAVNWCFENDKLLNIPAKNLDTSSISVLDYEVTRYGLIFIIMLPIAVFAAGVITYLRRRNL